MARKKRKRRTKSEYSELIDLTVDTSKVLIATSTVMALTSITTQALKK